MPIQAELLGEVPVVFVVWFGNDVPEDPVDFLDLVFGGEDGLAGGHILCRSLLLVVGAVGFAVGSRHTL